MQAVILAAGRGTRLHPITLSRTKAMTPILGKPIAERVMEQFIANGVTEFIFVVSPNDLEIRTYFQQKSRINANITFAAQSEQLGMGHALQQAIPHIHNDFLLSACDNLVSKNDIAQLITYWNKHPSIAGILATIPVGPEDIPRSGIVTLEGNTVTQIVEKPSVEEAPSNIASLPLYLFSKKILCHVPKINPSKRGEYELQDAIQMLIQNGGTVQAFQISGRSDLTTPEDLLAINLQYFEKRKIHQPPFLSSGSQFRIPVFIEENVSFGKNCLIGPNVFIENGCKIGNNVRIENAIVLRNRTVLEGTNIRNQVIW